MIKQSKEGGGSILLFNKGLGLVVLVQQGKKPSFFQIAKLRISQISAETDYFQNITRVQS